MPDWGSILQEINKNAAPSPSPADLVRRKYLASLYDYTSRDTILYASNWTQPNPFSELALINDEDVQGSCSPTSGPKQGIVDTV